MERARKNDSASSGRKRVADAAHQRRAVDPFAETHVAAGKADRVGIEDLPAEAGADLIERADPRNYSGRRAPCRHDQRIRIDLYGSDHRQCGSHVEGRPRSFYDS
jgi:hypothetical protein